MTGMIPNSLERRPPISGNLRLMRIATNRLEDGRRLEVRRELSSVCHPRSFQISSPIHLNRLSETGGPPL